MKKKDLIGRKVKGFEFKSTSYANLSYITPMNSYIGEVGEIAHYNCGNDSYRVIFKDKHYFYPASEIEKHLVDEWVIGQEYEFSDGYAWKKGKLLGIVDHDYKYITQPSHINHPVGYKQIRHIELQVTTKIVFLDNNNKRVSLTIDGTVVELTENKK